ncbi:protein NDRG2 [Nelusetta ayraudi]|uniref:protein NDRG2 n=1 Tax=Nelusetta ayraudi TaxID=303726 RepID=UPI003F6ECBE7
MTAEMQEIAITEEKPLLTGQADAKDAELAARILLDQGQEHSIETPHGVLHVTLHGTRTTRRPAILTFHDVGLDSKSCFSPLFKFEEMQEIVKNFTLIHVDAPGQEEGAAVYPAGHQFLPMETIAEMLPAVLQFFNFRTVIGVGVGAGAYILSKFALANPDLVEGLVLINIDTNARGWIDWAAQKLSSVTSSLTEQILSHLFSQEELSSNTDLVQSHRERISKASNIINIELFWKTYNSRRDLNIDRNSSFKCPVMLVVGDQAPYEDAAVECNSKMDPTTTSFLKACHGFLSASPSLDTLSFRRLSLTCDALCSLALLQMADAGGLPQLTQPAKLTEAFKYFIQGMGYMASSCMTRLSRSRTTSLSSSYSMDGSRSRSRTLSQGSQGGQMPPSPSQTMEVSC